MKSGKGCPKNIFIPIDTSLFSETDKKNWKGKNILNRIELTVKGSRINQHELALLDILANFKFQRPLYFISSQQTLDKFSLVGKGNPTTQEELLKYIGLLDYVQEEGCVSRFVPFRTNYANQQNTETENSFEIAMNDYRFGNVINPEVYYDYYSARSMLGFRYPYLRLAIALQQKGDSDKAIKLADKYFASIPISTDVLDPVSIKMSSIYINEEHKEGYKWSELLLKEYELQNNFLKEVELKGGYLSIDGKRLQQHTQKSIKDLKELRKNIKL